MATQDTTCCATSRPNWSGAFARLFLDQPAARVLRFLDEDTGPGDELRLIAALPPLPYLRAATRLAWHRAGSID